MYIFADKTKRLILGRQGENIVTEIKFPVAHWVDEFGAGTFEVLHRRPKDVDAAPVVTTYEDGYVVWTIKEADVQYRGEGNAQLVMRIGDAVAKSEVFTTVTLVSLSESENPPEVWRAWVDEVLAAAADAKDAVTKYPRINAANHWEIWSGGAWVDTGVTANGKDGEDGHTPIITASKQGKTTTVYVDGGQIATINDGTDGTDGHTPIMTGDKVGDVNTIYADGVPLISVEDGAGEEITHDAVINAIGYTPAEENAFTETRDKLDALWKLSEGRVYDIVEREENGVINPPSGAKYATVEEVRGKTEQESTNGYQMLRLISRLTTQTINGVTYTPIYDDKDNLLYINVNGTATANSTYIVRNYSNIDIAQGTYYCLPSGKQFTELRLTYGTNNATAEAHGTSWTQLVVDESTTKMYMQITTFGGSTINNEKCYPMISKVANVPYEPYTGGIATPNPDYPQEIKSVDSFKVIKSNKRYIGIIENANIGSNGVISASQSYYLVVSPLKGGVNILGVGGFFTEYPAIGSVEMRGTRIVGNDTSPEGTKYLVLRGSYSEANTATIGNKTVVLETSPSVVTEERTITPPRPLNRIGDYFDKADIENGVWEYGINRVDLKNLSWKIEESATWSYKRFASSKLPQNFLNGDIVISNISVSGYNLTGKTTLRISNNQAYIFADFDSLDDWNSYIQNNEAYFVAPIEAIVEEPISESDLAFLRSLENLPASDNIFITDNYGRDVSYLVEYIRKLSEVS